MADIPLPGGTVFVGGCLELGVDGLAYAPFTTRCACCHQSWNACPR